MPEARGLYEVPREKMRTRHFAYRTEQAFYPGFGVTLTFTIGSTRGKWGPRTWRPS